jgi:hypothetical protein
MPNPAVPNVPSPVDDAEEHLSLVGWRTRLIRLGPATPSRLLAQQSPPLTQAMPAASDLTGPSTINFAAIFANPQQAWPADMQAPPQPEPALDVGVEADFDSAAIDFVSGGLGWPTISLKRCSCSTFWGLLQVSLSRYNGRTRATNLASSPSTSAPPLGAEAWLHCWHAQVPSLLATNVVSWALSNPDSMQEVHRVSSVGSIDVPLVG